MNPFLLVGIIFGGALVVYLLFLGIGFGGVSKNRNAQGLDD